MIEGREAPPTRCGPTANGGIPVPKRHGVGREMPRPLGGTPPHEEWPGLDAGHEATDEPREDGR